MIQVWKRKRELSGFNKRTSSTEHAYFFHSTAEYIY